MDKVTNSYNTQPEGLERSTMQGITPMSKENMYPNWSAADLNLFGMKLLNKGDTMLSFAHNIGVSLNPRAGIIVNLERSKLVSAGSEQNGSCSMQTPNSQEELSGTILETK